jgi:drug/metabolite transporter (DMT)-like permease
MTEKSPSDDSAASRKADSSAHVRHSSDPVNAVAVAWMVGLTLIWGVNALSVKVATQGMTPIMAVGLRGALALAILTGYGWWRGERLTFSRIEWLHGTVNGLIFAVEFVLIYTGARLTSGGHIAIFINTAPFFVAIGAHYLLPGDRLHGLKVLGLTLAMGGIVLMFSDDLVSNTVGSPQAGQWRGDLLVFAGACLWGATTLYAKRYMVQRMSAFRILYSQLLVSTPVLLLAAATFERDPFFAVTGVTVAMIVFQAAVAVSFTYLMWTVLLQRYSASAMQSFAFLTPVWGVILGATVLGEDVRALMVAGIALVGLGIALVNRPRLRGNLLHANPLRRSQPRRDAQQAPRVPHPPAPAGAIPEPPQ